MGMIYGAVSEPRRAGKKIAGFSAVTVIENGDVADQLLDRKKHPEVAGRAGEDAPVAADQYQALNRFRDRATSLSSGEGDW